MNVDTFIEVANDCPAVHAEVPPARAGRATKAVIEYELIAGEPYALTKEEVAFRTRALMRDIPEADWPAERERLLSREKPVFESVRWPSATDGESTSRGAGADRVGGVSAPRCRPSAAPRSSVPIQARLTGAGRPDWARSLQRTQGGSLSVDQSTFAR